MSYTILSEDLHSTADRVKAFLEKEYGLTKINVETAIRETDSWVPTLWAKTPDHHIVCVEVTAGSYVPPLHRFVNQCVRDSLPVKLFVAFPDDGTDRKYVLQTFKEAAANGVGVIHLEHGKCNVLRSPIELSLASVRRVKSSDFKSKYRMTFQEAYDTFLGGDPVGACGTVYSELESLTRKAATKIAEKHPDWWTPDPSIAGSLETCPWARLLRDLGSNLTVKKAKAKCPQLTVSLIQRIGGLTDPRNGVSHKPRTMQAVSDRDAKLRTAFEHAIDVFIEFQNAIGPLRI